MIKKNIFQYWDEVSPPNEIQENISGWIIKNTEWTHFLYNDNTARKFLIENFDKSVVSAYDSCCFPQMRSDLFRLAILYKFGGVYVDAGIACVKPLDEWIIAYLEQSKPTFVRKWHGALMNGFIISDIGNQFILKAMQIAVVNIFLKNSNNIYDVTGPRIINQILNNTKAQFGEINFNTFKENIKLRNHKMNEHDHWSEKQKTMSIFKKNNQLELKSKELCLLFDEPSFRTIPFTERLKITKLLEKAFEQIVDIIVPDLILEIGAFEADFSIRMKSHYPTATVLAFEANPRVYEKYKDTVKNKGVIYIHAAVSNTSETITFYIPEIVDGNKITYENSMGSLNEMGLDNSISTPVSVQAVLLDEFLVAYPHKLSVAWIDVEGAVDKILEGMIHTLNKCEVIFCELETSTVWKNQKLDQDILKKLSDLGFVLLVRDCQKAFQYNGIFIKKELTANAEIIDICNGYIEEANQLWGTICLEFINFSFWSEKNKIMPISEENHQLELKSKELCLLFDEPSFRKIPFPERLKITKLLEMAFEQIVELIVPDLILEIGAFEADFSIRMKSHYPTATVLAFEANPRVYEKYKDTVKNKGVIYTHAAVSNTFETITFYIPEIVDGNKIPYENRMGSLNEMGLDNSISTPVSVQAVLLDEFLVTYPHKLSVAWIDVEGAVDKILEGMIHTLNKCEVIFCELETSTVWKNQKLDQDILKKLSDLGFVLLVRDCQKAFQYNGIFIKKELTNNKEITEICNRYVEKATQLWGGICLEFTKTKS